MKLGPLTVIKSETWKGYEERIEAQERDIRIILERQERDIRIILEREGALMGQVDGCNNIIKNLLNLSYDSKERTLSAEEILKVGVERRKKKSAIFFHNSYYHYHYLSRELKSRGWYVSTVNIDDPGSRDNIFWHNSDIDLFDPDSEKMAANFRNIHEEILRRYNVVFFYGMGRTSMVPDFWFNNPFSDNLPRDTLTFRDFGIRIGHTTTGCYDINSRSSFSKWSDDACASCSYNDKPEMCSDIVNLARGQRVYSTCDIIECEQMPALDYLTGEKVYHGPLTFALDPDVWSPALEIPEKHRLPREEGELIVYQGVANYAMRTSNGINLKGTWAVQEAIERLRAEGMNVRLEFCHDVPNQTVRFIQAQADVIVDQLLFGRYGAQGREGMMLGKPVIAHLNDKPDERGRVPDWLEECPVVRATPDTIYGVLKDLLSNPDKREKIGKESRDYALRYYSAGACADRFEKVYEELVFNSRVLEFSV